MQVDRIILALALVAPATPVLAEKCSVCDFSDEPIVVKPKKASAPAPAGHVPAALTAGQAGQRNDEWGKPTPLLMQPLTVNERSSSPHVGALPGAQGSSKPKEIVVVGSKIEPNGSPAGTEWASVATVLEERVRRAAPSVGELVVTKSTDLASTPLVRSSSQGRALGSGSGNDVLISGFGNDTVKRQGGLSAATLPQPAGTQVFYLDGTPAPRTALTGAASGRPAESISFNFTKVEYKYTPYHAQGPAAGAMAVRR
jgi:hypothetical protein